MGKTAIPVVIIDRDPAKLSYASSHFLTKEEVIQKIEDSVFVLDRIETFLFQHNIYILKLGEKTEARQNREIPLLL